MPQKSFLHKQMTEKKIEMEHQNKKMAKSEFLKKIGFFTPSPHFFALKQLELSLESIIT